VLDPRTSVRCRSSQLAGGRPPTGTRARLDRLVDPRGVGLDLAKLPGADLPADRLAVVRAAATAWETANGWIVEPSYARRQLALPQAGTDNFP
jgi:hypothetical protein